MDDLTKLTVESFLDEVADRTPTPGGGAVSALAGGLACAMARMVAAYSEPNRDRKEAANPNHDRKEAANPPSVNKHTKAPVPSKVQAAATALHRADELSRALITQDAIAYTEMTGAAKAARGDPSKKPAYDQAVLAAIAVPMEMAAVASNALSTMDELKSIASRYLLSDLGIAAVLACATARAARYNVRINAPELADPATRARILAEIDRIVDHCEDSRASIEGFVGAGLEDPSMPSR